MYIQYLYVHQTNTSTCFSIIPSNSPFTLHKRIAMLAFAFDYSLWLYLFMSQTIRLLINACDLHYKYLDWIHTLEYNGIQWWHLTIRADYISICFRLFDSLSIACNIHYNSIHCLQLTIAWLFATAIYIYFFGNLNKLYDGCLYL